MEEDKRVVTYLNIDICDSTKIKDSAETRKKTFDKLWKRLGEIAKKYQGKLFGNIIGDEAIYQFLEKPDNAVEAAIETVKMLDDFNKQSELKKKIHVRIGIETGEETVFEEPDAGKIVSDPLGLSAHYRKYSKEKDVIVIGVKVKEQLVNEKLIQLFPEEGTVEKDDRKYQVYKYIEKLEQSKIEDKEKHFKIFISCDPVSDIRTYLENNYIDSIYRTCGIEPWFIIFNAYYSNEDLWISNSINNFKLYPDMGIKYMTVSSLKHEIDVKESNFPDFDEGVSIIVSWIFLKGGEIEEYNCMKGFLEDCIGFQQERSEVFRVTEAYNTFGEYRYIMKLETQNIGGIDSFLHFCNKNKILTQTKCTLSTLKENGLVINVDDKIKREKFETITRDHEYSLLRIMANSENFTRMGFKEQCDYIKQEIVDKVMGIKSKNHGAYLLESRLNLNPVICDADKQAHPNRYIERYSVKLNKDYWGKCLYFFRARPGLRNELKKWIKDEFLGVREGRFSRKLYVMAGVFDFIVPIDIKDNKVIDVVNKEIYKQVDLVENFVITLCDDNMDSKNAIPLDRIDESVLKALMVNSMDIDDLMLRIPDILNELKSKTVVNAFEYGRSPRDDMVRANIFENCTGDIDGYLDKIENVKNRLPENIGIKTSIEYCDRTLVQVFMKFYFKDKISKEIFLSQMKDKIGKYKIMGIKYQPLKNPLYVAYIITVKELLEIEILIEETEGLCRKIEFHVLFRQEFYTKQLPINIRCKPCVYSKGLENCSVCVNYTNIRQRDMKLNILCSPRPYEHIDLVRISSISANMKLSQMFLLNNVNINELEDVIVKIEPDNSEGSELIKFLSSAISEYKDMQRIKDEILEDYGEAVEQIIQTSLESDIIVFPKYFLTKFLYKRVLKIITNYKKDNQILVLGSHIDESYNICPISFLNSGNRKTHVLYETSDKALGIERKLGLIGKYGTANQNFLETRYGNLAIRLSGSPELKQDYLHDIDILITLGLDYDVDIEEKIKHKVSDYSLVAVYCNSIHGGEQRQQIYFPEKPNNDYNLHKEGDCHFLQEQSKGEYDMSYLDIAKKHFKFDISTLKFSLMQHKGTKM